MYQNIPYLIAAYVLIFGSVLAYHLWMKREESRVGGAIEAAKKGDAEA